MRSYNPYRDCNPHRRRFMVGSAAVAGSLALPPWAGRLARAASTPSEGAAYAVELWEKTKQALASGEFRRQLNLHSWEGYTEEPVLDPFSREINAEVQAQMLISDPAAVNNLRGGGTSTWDVINLNNAWQRKMLYPEDLILPLDAAKFEPLYAMNTPGFEWPYLWAMDESGEQLLGMIQRYGPSGMAVNGDALDPAMVESEGYMAMIEGAAGEYGILDYENWVIMHTCMAAGFSPFREHTADEMEAFREMIFKVFANAKKVSDDQATLARDMITGEIVGTFPGSVYSVSAARMEGETQIQCVVPAEGPEETKTADAPNGKSGIVWIEITSLVNNPDYTPLAEAFLIYCHTPEASYRVAAQSPGTLNPVVQMGAPEVLEKFGEDELEAIQWGEGGEWLNTLVGRCLDFDINPDYDAMHDMYTEAKRSRGA